MYFKITDYWIKHTSSKAKIFQKKKTLKVKMWSLHHMAEFDLLARARVFFLRNSVQASSFSNENRKENRQKAFLNKNFIQVSLCSSQRKKCI